MAAEAEERPDANETAENNGSSPTLPFFEAVAARARKIDSYLCVGLDPHGAKDAKEAEAVSLAIVEATAPYACCYKPNSAFFEAHGGDGLDALRRVITFIHETFHIPVLLDCKRGDVGSTATQYAAAAFGSLNADAVTLSPYLGWDALEPFVGASSKYRGRGAFVLCATSNKSARSVQSDATRRNVARRCADDGDWGSLANSRPLGLVVGATDLDALVLAREENQDAWILAPGVGAQGADVAAAVRAGRSTKRGPNDPRLLVPVSRGLLDAPNRAAAACDLRDAINAALRFSPSPCEDTMIASEEEEEEEEDHSVKKQPNEEAEDERDEARSLHPRRRRPPPSHHTRRSKAASSRAKFFVETALACGALKFGSFKLKSGRASPYFFNAGLFSRGDHVDALFEAYSRRINEATSLEFDVVFGPAYKGIPLCAGVAAALSRTFNVTVAYAYNRKEVKDHGEGGTVVGARLENKRVLLVDDVISAGTAIREASGIIKTNGGILVAACVALDREEVTGGADLPAPGAPRVSAVDAAEHDLGVPVLSILTLTDLLYYLEEARSDGDDTNVAVVEGLTTHAAAVRQYRADYGVSS